MARGDHVFRSCEICKQTYIIAQKNAGHLTGDTGSTGRYFSMCAEDKDNKTLEDRMNEYSLQYNIVSEKGEISAKQCNIC